MHTDILVHPKDQADAENMLPVAQVLQKNGHKVYVAVELNSPAHHHLKKYYEKLAPYTIVYLDISALTNKIKKTKVLLSGMVSRAKNRATLYHYQKQGTWTAVFQETPGWRLTHWEMLPNAVFAMPHAKEIIMKEWKNFKGTVHETNMPHYQLTKEHAQSIDKNIARRHLHIPQNSPVIQYCVPADYGGEILSFIADIVQNNPDTAALMRIHPKASDAEKILFRNFCKRHGHITDVSSQPLLESFVASDVIIANIVSTTLVQASLAGSIPVALTTPESLTELHGLGSFENAEAFPYIKNNHILSAGTTEELAQILKDIFANKISTNPFPVSENSIETIVQIVEKELQTNEKLEYVT